MNRWSLLLLGLLAPASVSADTAEDLAVLLRATADNAARRAAADRLRREPPTILPQLLRAWPTNDPVAANWLRTTIEDIAAGQSQPLPKPEILAIVQNPSLPGKARRVALGILESVEPGTTARLLPNLRTDPEFGPDAVAQLLHDAEATGDKTRSLALLREAFRAAVQVEQILTIRKKLAELGDTPNLPEKLGLIAAWQVIGPFPVDCEEGLRSSFPPEKGFDPKATYDGRNGPLRWAGASIDAEGRVDLVKAGITPDKGSVAYAFAVIRVSAATQAELRIACVDNVTAWVNGTEIVKHATTYRSHLRPDRHRGGVELKAGENTVLLKLTKTPPEEGGRPGAPIKWDFSVRLVQANLQGLPFADGGTP